jgi:hypothetical protein
MRRASQLALGLALFLAPASYAISVSLPTEDTTLNVDVQLQPQFLVNEAGSPDGTSPSYDLFLRRARFSVGGNVGKHFSYFFQTDSPNFGKFGNFTTRVLVQDAWISWAPTGIEGGTVAYVEAGLLYIPFSRNVVTSTRNFITTDFQTDALRIPNNPFPAFRSVGVGVRGWALDKKIGFRGGVYEGYGPIDQTAGTCAADGAGCITPKRYPLFSGFVNVDLIGSEEGVWLYNAYRWATSPVLSISGAATYQAQALKNAFGSLANLRIFSATAYLNLPMTEQAELVVEATGYLNGNGTGSPNNGAGFAAAAGYRFGFIAPYAAYDFFESSGCSGGGGTASEFAACEANVNTANSRNFKAGLNLFFDKSNNHVNIEFGINHGLSIYGPSSITAPTAGYVPASLDPLTPGGPRRAFTNSLANPNFKSLVVQWTIYI